MLFQPFRLISRFGHQAAAFHFHKELQARDLVMLDFDPGQIWRCGFLAKGESLYAKPIGILADTFDKVCGKLR